LLQDRRQSFSDHCFLVRGEEETMKTELCSNCGAVASVLLDRDYQLEGVDFPVTLRKIELIKCSSCGNVDPIIPNMDDMMNALAMAVICQPVKLTGAKIRFLRKFVGKSAEEFARLIHVDHTHLSKVENEHLPVGDQSDRLIRLLVLNMSPELKDKANRLIELFPSIQDSLCSDTRSDIQINPSTMEAQYA
jgi:DNA-binding transcriptional regulator YiaG